MSISLERQGVELREGTAGGVHRERGGGEGETERGGGRQTDRQTGRE